MVIDVNECDLNNDYYHFTNVANIQSIVNGGLQPLVGTASNMVGDRPNVSISHGGKGVMGIINSFIHMFSILSISQIPNEFRKYFVDDINDFTSNIPVGLDISCRAVARKLKDEVFFRIILDESMLREARIGGLTGFDINLPTAIDGSNLQLVTNSGEILTAFDFAQFIYERVKDKDIFREMNEDFFRMFEMEQSKLFLNDEDFGKHR